MSDYNRNQYSKETAGGPTPQYSEIDEVRQYYNSYGNNEHEKIKLLSQKFQNKALKIEEILQIIVEDGGSQNSSFLILQGMLNFMREFDFEKVGYYFQQTQLMIQLVEKCIDIDCVALIVQEVVLHNQSERYLSSLFYNIGQEVALKIQSFQSEKILDQKFYTQEFTDYIEKYHLNNQLNNNVKIQPLNQQNNKIQEKSIYQQKIEIIIENIIFRLSENIQNMTALQKILVKYIALLPSETEQQLKDIKKLSNIITSYCVRKGRDLDANLVSNLVNYILNIMKLPIQEQKQNPLNLPQNLSQNMFAIIEDFDQKIITQLFSDYYSQVMYDMYCLDDILIMFNNMVTFQYIPSFLQIMYQICKRYELEQRYDLLFDIYTQFIKTKIFPQIRCINCFDITLNLIQLFFCGFQEIRECEFSKQDWQHFIDLKPYLKYFSNIQLERIFQFLEFMISLPMFGKNPKNKDEIQKIIEILQEIDIQYQNKFYKKIVFLSEKDKQIKQKQNFISTKSQITQIENIVIGNPADFKGLQNLGNTCYMNSYLQCLFMAKNFRKFIIYQQIPMDPKNLLSDTSDCFQQLLKLFYGQIHDKQIAEPLAFKNSLPPFFRESEDQQDAGEFGRQLLEILENALKEKSLQQSQIKSNSKLSQSSVLKQSDDNKKQTMNQIQRLFCGQLINQMKCSACNSTFQTKEQVMDLNVNFPQKPQQQEQQQQKQQQQQQQNVQQQNQNDNPYAYQNYDQPKQQQQQQEQALQKPHSLLSMIKDYFSTEIFMDGELYDCDKCNKKTERATKCILLDQLPPYLIITINRFQYDRLKQINIKMTDKVDIPFQFSLKEVFPEFRISEKQGTDYKLFAMVVHLGSSSNGGHYIAYCRDIEDQKNNNHSKWQCFDDSMVQTYDATQYSDFDQNWAEHETAYICFFCNDSGNPVNLYNYARKTSLIKSNINQSSIM